jgi:hypothetical protein
VPLGITSGPDGNLWFTTTIGDDNQVLGKVTPDGQISEFTYTHYFDQPASIVTGPDGNLWFTESANVGVILPPQPLPGTVLSFAATEGVAVPASTVIATFTDPDPTVDSSQFTATIHWGDGTTSDVSVTQTGGAGSPFQVAGGHTYTEDGGYPVTVVVHDNVNHIDSIGNVNISRQSGSQSEGTIAVDPTNPARLFASSNDNAASTGLFAAYSTDGGATWTTRTLGTGSGAGGDGLPVSYSDPEAAFDRYGNLFLTYIDSTGTAVEILESTDGGPSFHLVQSVSDFTDLQGVDQTKITTGPGPGGAGGTVWVAYRDGNARIATVAASVTAPGQDLTGAFGASQEVAGSGGGNYDSIAVGPNGQALVSWQNNPGTSGPSSIYVSLDSDGLGTGGWGPVVRVTGSNVGGMFPIPPQANRTIDTEPKLDWDRSGGKYNGRVYMSYTDSGGASRPNTDIYLVYSDDDGATWSNPLRVNDDQGTNSQFLPSIAVDQSTGNVAVSWYDARNDPNNVKVQLFAAISNDGGTSFLPNVELSNGQTDATNPMLSGVAKANQLGDYTTTAFAGGVFYPIWTDNSPLLGGNPNLPEFDMATQRVVVEQVADAPLTATKGSDVSSVAGSALPSVTVATFTDGNPTPDPSEFTASIDWGDNTAPTTGTITGTSKFTITGTHTYANSGTYSIVVTINDAGGARAVTGEKAAVSPPVLGPPNAPQLDAADDTGVSNSDGITNHDGSAGAPLDVTVTGVDPPNAKVWVYDVDSNPPVRISTAHFDATDGTVHFLLNGSLADGTYDLTATTTLSATGPESDMSPVAKFVIQTSVSITSTSPADGTAASALPGGVFTLKLSHVLAGLSDGGPALGAGNPSALTITPAGGGAAVPISTQYHVGADGTATIVLEPVSALAPGAYVVHVDPSGFHDLAGNTLTAPAAGFRFTINAGPDQTSVSSPTIDPAAGVAGQTITFTVAVVDDTSSAVIPTGEVDIKNGSAVIGSGQLDATGHAKIMVPLPQGSYSITAVYAGNSSLATSTSPAEAYTVNAPPAARTFIAAFTVASVPATAGKPITITATVSNADGSATPTGEVDIIANGSMMIGTGTLDSNGNVTIVVTLPAGSYTVAVVYKGNGSFQEASSPRIPVTVSAGTSMSQPQPGGSPQPAGAPTIGRSKQGLTSIGFSFGVTLDPSAASTALYRVLGAVKKKGKTVYSKAVHVKNVSLSADSKSVTINLAKPFKGVAQVTIEPGLKASGGASTTSPLMFVVH